ncbi:unnamed protein product [Cylindrotheca closterium]|uniref:Uncharacterized protein n=1 Tax=Cylindrotheca closterium TaxID=2856 RepID=A0AAD2CML0_9STRA|nr:unnamed protein product [Cylindrotheca closterium]
MKNLYQDSVVADEKADVSKSDERGRGDDYSYSAEASFVSGDDCSSGSSGNVSMEKEESEEFDDTSAVAQKKYSKNDEVLYISSNRETEIATILKVHLDDQLVPYYDIQLNLSGREKQTDGTHLAAPPKSHSEKRVSNDIKECTPETPTQQQSNVDTDVKPQKTFAENDKVVYVSSNGESENATVVKVYLDAELVPFYDIRLHSSGREKQTDDAHLMPCRERKRPQPIESANKPERRSSAPDQWTKKTGAPRRRSSIAFGCADHSDGSVPKKTYAENEKVIYVSSDGDSENATIIKVHLDDQLVPFYDIRLHSSDREKQTDDAHLKPCRERKKSVAYGKVFPDGFVSPHRAPKKTASLAAPEPLGRGSAHSEGFVSPRQAGKRTKAPKRRTSLPMPDPLCGSNHSNGFVSPRQEKQTNKAPSRKSNLSASVPLHINLPDGFVSPHQGKQTKAPRRRTSLSNHALPEGFVSPQGKRKSKAPRKRTSLPSPDQFGNGLHAGFVSPRQEGKRTNKAPRRRTSLPAQDSLGGSNHSGGFVSPQPKRRTAPKPSLSNDFSDGLASQTRKRTSMPGRIKSMGMTAQSMMSPKSANRRAGSDSAIPRQDRLDRLDLTSSRGSNSKRPKALRTRSVDNSGAGGSAADFKPTSPVGRSKSASLIGKAKKKIIFQWNPRTADGIT